MYLMLKISSKVLFSQYLINFNYTLSLHYFEHLNPLNILEYSDILHLSATLPFPG